MTKILCRFLVAFTALGAFLVNGRADIKVQVWPDKLAYDIDEPCTIGVTVSNAGADSRKVNLTAHVEYETDSRETLAEKAITVEAGKEEKLTLSWKPGRAVLGCGVVAEATEGGKPVARDEEYFNVVPKADIARVGIAAQTRISQQTEGPDAHWNEVERAKNQFYAREGIRKGYINIVECHGLYADAFARLTPNEAELKSDYFLGGFPYGISGTKDQIAVMKKNGVRTTMYATSYTDAAIGLELARQRPDLVMRYERGQASINLFDVKEIEKEENYTRAGFRMMPYGWLPNQTSRETLDIAVQELKKARAFWGTDGVRWDGHYSPAFYYLFAGHTFFNYKGEPVPPLADSDRLTAENMRYVKNALWKEYPDYLFMANMMWPENIPPDQRSEEYAVMMEKGGAACNEPSNNSHTQGTPFNRWSDMSRLLVFQSDKAREYGGYVYAYPDTSWTVSATFSRLQYSLLYAARNRPWFAAALYNHFICGYEPQIDKKLLPYSDATRPITRFATRYSAILFGYGVDRIKTPDSILSVAGPQPIWWKDYVHTRKISDHKKQITVDLLNPPPRELARADADESDFPKPQQDVALTLTTKPGETVDAVWYLSPEIEWMKKKIATETKAEKEVSIYNAMTGTTIKVDPQTSGQTVKVVVPELKYWGIVVFNLTTK